MKKENKFMEGLQKVKTDAAKNFGSGAPVSKFFSIDYFLIRFK